MSIVTDGLRIKLHAIEDLESFLANAFPASIEVRARPFLVALSGPDGQIRWQTTLRQAASFRSPEIHTYLSNLPVSHFLYLQPCDTHYRIADICLRHMSQIAGIEQLGEQATMQLCAEHPALKYILDHWCEHVNLISSESLLHTFASSAAFRQEHLCARLEKLLPFAARQGNLLLVQKLLVVTGLHPDIRESGEDSHTALSLASCNNHREVVKLLLSHPQTNTDLLVAGRRTALHLSITFENFGLARLLLRRGASQTITDAHGRAAASLLLRTTGSRRSSHGLGSQRSPTSGKRSYDVYRQELKQTVDVLLATRSYESALILTPADIDMANEHGNSAFVEQMLRECHGKVLIEEPPRSPGSEDGRRSNKSEVWYEDEDEENDEEEDEDEDDYLDEIRSRDFKGKHVKPKHRKKKKKSRCCVVM
jgi:hypothetical protein